MSTHAADRQSIGLVDEIKTMKIETSEHSEGEDGGARRQPSTDSRRNGQPQPSVKVEPSFHRTSTTSASQSPHKHTSIPGSPMMKSEQEETVGGDISVKLEPGKAPKLSRSSTKKIPLRPPPLYLDIPDSTLEATSSFDQISSCTYANKYLGTTDHALECDCSEEWDAATQTNHACGDDSDCINRATKMECVGDCNCGSACQNQRFQQHRYAPVTVIKTEKKGYGLRANVDLPANAFIFEYIGEVIGEALFRRRIVQYDEEGIKHFYFMSLNKGEFVDATKKGNLGRFCNHSCNPNCYVDKWVVGDRLRMGIFADRKIAAGEELVFNYNVDRYGADPQPCYCGEPNCTGFIGGKTQTERATKLSAATIEALGIEDGEDWDIAVAKKGRKKKVDGENDEEYVDSMQPKSLDEAGVTKVMATLMQCKEKWIAVKLLGRLQRCEEDRVRNRVVKMHGYQILNTALTNFGDDANIALQILDILNMLPRLTRNKIQDSKIEPSVEKLLASEDERVRDQAAVILKLWSALEVAYRIPRLKRDPAAIAAAEKADREERRRIGRDRSRSRSRSKSESPIPPKGPAAPSGPRAGLPQRPPSFFPTRPPFRRAFPASLPTGWFAAQANGQTYYYSASGQTTWQRPTIPAVQPPPPPKEKTNEQKLQEIINSITKTEPSKDNNSSSTATPVAIVELPLEVRKERKEKWRSYSEEKRKKLYENTLFPHVKYVMDKFKGKLPKDDLKRFAKEVSKKLVNSDFKNKRVEDPTQISFKQERNVKKFVKDYFDKAVAKKAEHDRKKADDKKTKPHTSHGTGTETPAAVLVENQVKADDEDIVLSENEIEDDEEDEPSTAPSTSHDTFSPGGELLKRKREADETPLTGLTPDQEDGTPVKRLRDESSPAEPPPPPPPPPPPSGNPPTSAFQTEEDAQMGSEEYDAEVPVGCPTQNGFDLVGRGAILEWDDETKAAEWDRDESKDAKYDHDERKEAEWSENRWGEKDVDVR